MKDIAQKQSDGQKGQVFKPASWKNVRFRTRKRWGGEKQPTDSPDSHTDAKQPLLEVGKRAGKHKPEGLKKV